jgi:hypothetical protein
MCIILAVLAVIGLALVSILIATAQPHFKFNRNTRGEFSMKTYRALFSVIALSLLALAMLMILNQRSASALTTNYFVKTTGSGGTCLQGAPCKLQTALSLANTGDTIYVASGTYTGTGSAVVTVTKSITLAGGWNGAASGPIVRAAATYVSKLDGQLKRRVIFLGAAITTTIDGFVIERGNATGIGLANCFGSGGAPAGCGGGLYGRDTHAIIVNNTITNNYAALSSTFYYSTAYGGGLYLYHSDRTIISGNLFISNTASVLNSGSGGAMYLYGPLTNGRVEHNQIISNSATISGSVGWGGGIAIGSTSGAPVFRFNVIKGNQGGPDLQSQGAAFFSWYDYDTNGVTQITDNNMSSNSHAREAVQLGHSSARFDRNWVVNNSTLNGILLNDGNGGSVVMTNNFIESKHGIVLVASGYNSANALTVTLVHNTLSSFGGQIGIFVGQGSSVTLRLTNTIIANVTTAISNTAPSIASVRALRTLFYSVTTQASSGVVNGNPLTGNPNFVNPLIGDYHLGPSSAAIDQASGHWVSDDIDRQARPIGPASDIGADETRRYQLFLPLALKNF